MGGVLTVVGTVLNAASQAQQNRAQAEAAKNNARIAEINADIARQDGRAAQAEAAKRAYQDQGRRRAAQAQKGILGSATGSLLLNQAESEAAEEQLKIGREAQRQAQSHLVSAANARNQAKQNRRAAPFNLLGGAIGSNTSILGGISDAYQDHLLKKKQKESASS